MVLHSIVLVALLFGISANCESSFASSGSQTSSNGPGSTYTYTGHNGQGHFQSQGPAYADLANRFDNSNPGNNYNTNNNNGWNNGFAGQSPYYGPNYNPNNFGGYGPFGQFGNYGAGFNSYQPFQPAPPFGYPAPFAPPPLLSPEQFNKQVSDYLLSAQQQYADVGTGGSFTYSTPGASAYASSYKGPVKWYNRQQSYLNAWKDGQTQNYFGGQSGPSKPNYSYATGSYSPNGIYQSAGVYPPNKNKPNVANRFDAQDTAGKPSFVGISTSSFSNSANGPNGPVHKEGAITTVNDNGKVTVEKIESK